MDKNLHTLLAGPLYINDMYGVSLIPYIYKSFNSDSLKEKSIEDIIKEKQIASINSSLNSTANKVVVLDFKQPVLKFNYGYWLGTKAYTSILESLKKDDTVVGVVLDMDSGGGQVYGTPEFYDYILNYPKPIVTYSDGYLCSGAYYIAAATNKIITNKRADAIGSIGAYATIVDSDGIWEHFGAKVHTIYATKSTAKNSEYREVIENSNYEPYIKNQLDPIVETFINDMKATRPQISEEVFKGGTWNGEQSVQLGLADENGSLQTAIDKVFELASEKSNQKSNNNMSKQRAKLQGVLNLDAPLASTEEKGSYLNEEQLDEIETNLEALETTNADLQTQISEAATAHQTALDAVNNQLAEATNNATAFETSVDGIMVNLGLPTEGSLTEKLSVLADKTAILGKNDGAGITNPKIGTSASSAKLADLDIPGVVNVSASLDC